MLTSDEFDSALAEASDDTARSILLLQRARDELANAMGYDASKGFDTTDDAARLVKLKAQIEALRADTAPPLDAGDQAKLLNDIKAVDASAASGAAIDGLIATIGALLGG